MGAPKVEENQGAGRACLFRALDAVTLLTLLQNHGCGRPIAVGVSTRAGTSDHGMCRQLKLYAFVLQLRVAPGRFVQLWLGVGSSSHSTLWRRCSSPGLPQTTDDLGKILTQPRATLLAIWGTGILGIVLRS